MKMNKQRNLPGPHFNTNKQFLNSIIDDPSISKDIIKLKQKWHIPLSGFSDKEKEMQKWNKKVTGKAAILFSFRMDVKQLLEEHDIPPQWNETISNYLMYGRKMVPLSEVLGIEIVDGRSGEKELLIRCTANVRIRDIKSVWGMIQKMQRRMPNFGHKTRPKKDKNLYRDKLILKMASQGKTIPEISESMCKRFLQFDLTEDGIRQVIKRSKRTPIVSNKNRA